MSNTDRRFRMVQALIAGHVPVQLSTIVVGGDRRDEQIRMFVFACLFAQVPTYQVFHTSRRIDVDADALRREIAECRLPDHVDVRYSEVRAQQAWTTSLGVSTTLSVPIGFYAKGRYASDDQPVQSLVFFGAIPPSFFLNKLKYVARG